MSHPLRASDPRRVGAYAVESRLGEGGWITGIWDRATPATKAAVWEEIPGWFEERYPQDSYGS
jgi:hypothetical protein